MKSQERQNRIMETALKNSFVSIPKIAQQLGVSVVRLWYPKFLARKRSRGAINHLAASATGSARR